MINNSIDVEAVRSSGSKSMLCSSCNEKLPATARCLDCMEFLCYACHSAHNRVRMTKDHQVFLFEHNRVRMTKDHQVFLTVLTTGSEWLKITRYFCLKLQFSRLSLWLYFYPTKNPPPTWWWFTSFAEVTLASKPQWGYDLVSPLYKVLNTSGSRDTKKSPN